MWLICKYNDNTNIRTFFFYSENIVKYNKNHTSWNYTALTGWVAKFTIKIQALFQDIFHWISRTQMCTERKPTSLVHTIMERWCVLRPMTWPIWRWFSYIEQGPLRCLDVLTAVRESSWQPWLHISGRIPPGCLGLDLFLPVGGHLQSLLDPVVDFLGGFFGMTLGDSSYQIKRTELIIDNGLYHHSPLTHWGKIYMDRWSVSIFIQSKSW